MMKYLTRVFLIILPGLLGACGTGQFGSSYHSYMDPRLNPDLVALAEKTEPNIIHSNKMDRDVQNYREHNYVVVGESAFNGIAESDGNAKRQAKEVGATHVIISSEYTDTESRLHYDYQDYYRTFFVDRVRSIDGKRVVVREAVTVRDTVTVPYMRYYDNYDQWAVYLVKSNRMHKLGLIMRDLGPDERAALKRNTGAYIDVVLSNSPAYLADIVARDVLVEINGIRVNGAAHAQQMIRDLDLGGKTIVLGVLKDGKQKDITFEFNEQTVGG